MVNKAKIGSISCGTLRTQDLLRAFADELERLSGGAEVIVAPYNSCVIADAREWASRLDAEDVSPSDELEAQEILGDIANELDKRAPAFCYFGAAEGDGADFGFWAEEEGVARVEWSGSPAPECPDDWWIDDKTGEYVSATTNERMSRDDALRIINGKA